MKIRKLVSSFGAVTAAVTASALMLVSAAGALDIYYADLSGVASSDPDRTAKISAFAVQEISNNSSLAAMGENTILTPEIISALNREFSKFSAHTNVLDLDTNAIELVAKHTVSGVPDVKYSVFLTKDFLEANLGGTVNVSLSEDTYGKTGELKLSNTSVGYYGTLVYSIWSDSAKALYDAYEVETNDQLLVSNNSTTDPFVLIKTNPSASLTFAMSSSNGTSSGLYVSKYDSKSLEYFKGNDLLNIIKADIAAELGFTASDLENSTVKEYIDRKAEEIKKEILGDGTVKYATMSDVEKAVHDFYLGKTTVDGKTVFTDEAYVHQKELAEAVMQTDEAQAIIKDSIYNAFGIGISEREAEELKNALWDDLVEKTVKEMNDYENGTSSQIGNISYFLSRITSEEYKNLAAEIEEVKQKLKGYDVSLADILTGLNECKQKLSDDSITISDLLAFMNDTDSYLNVGRDTTLSDVLNNLVEQLQNYAQNEGYSAYSDSKDYTDQAKSDAISSSQKYTDNQLLITNYELQSQLNALKKRIEEVEDELDDLRYERDYYYNNYYNTSDWIIRTYGSVDRFIAAVADEAANRMTANGKTGESAYDIAVRNGFRGTEQEWLNSLVGASAYDIAVQNGYRGSQEEWLESLRGEDGQDGMDGQDGRDGEDGRVIYVYGDQPQSGAPAFEDEEEEDPDSVVSGAVFGNDAEIVEPDNGTVGRTNVPVAGNTSAPSANNTANPKTGVAAGIIIPIAAVGSLLLIKKDKRRRGRK